jgi:DNA-binding protein HU-beta
VNKSELISAAAERSGVMKKDAEQVIGAAFDIIIAQLQKGEKVQISGFGTFELKDREARVGRNPHTGEAVQIPAAKVPAFKASKTLKEKITE